MKILKSALVSAAILAAPLAASAATVTIGDSATKFETTAVTTATVPGGATSITFSYVKPPVMAYQDFTTTGTTTIRLVDYLPDLLSVMSKFAIYFNGTAITSGSNCGSNFAGTNGNSCVAITGQNGKPGAAQAPLVFENLAAGDYRIAFFNRQQPKAGAVQFEVSSVSAVPLPAGGLLLLSAFGAAAAVRRRKKAVA